MPMQFQQRLQRPPIFAKEVVVQSHILYVYICYLFDQDLSYWIFISIHTLVSKLLLLLNGPSSNVLLSWSYSTFAFFYGLYFAEALLRVSLFLFRKKNPEIPYSPSGSFKAVSKKNVTTYLHYWVLICLVAFIAQVYSML